MTTQQPSQENYSLRWNNHQSHILESFDALLQQNSLVDVTLVCADRSLRAHKVVLSACSPFFEKVFNDTPCKHPTIVLKDYQRWVVQAIIDFMYRGEISVPQERLSQLIQAGESLQIRGLIGAIPEAVESEKRECVSPMPRRKQARPRRRSGDLTGELPQDLSNGQITTKSERDGSVIDSDENEDVELHEIAKRVRQNGNGSASIADDDDEEDEEELEEETEEKENKPGSETLVDVPENLCTKKSTSDSSDSSIVNDKNNNSDGGSKKRPIMPPHDFHERFILSLKDLRHLNRYRQGPPPGHPFNDLLSHLPISPPPSFQMSTGSGERRERGGSEPKRCADDDMKMESDHSDAETSPFPDQIDLSQHPSFQQHEKNMRDRQKLGQMMGHHNSGMPPFPPPPFQGDGSMRNMHGSHPSQSPLHFPGMPGSAMNLTPPHMFGLDSPLGLFPPGMDPTKMYNPLMDLPDHPSHHRPLHPDHPSFLKKKLQRPKGQHSAPRGGPPRSWTNAELTEALQHVWNKKMTTSQASRIFGIPYNSLLMYVRGKYGKSLKLEQLRKECISGPPIEMLQMNPNAPGGMQEKRDKKDKDDNDEMSSRNSESHQGSRRSTSSDPDMMNPLFSPFPGGFYPEFSGPPGFPSLQLSMLNLLPPDARLHQPMMPMVLDDDCKSDAGSVQSLDDSLPPTPLNLNHREKNGNSLDQPQLASGRSQQMFQN